MAFLKIVVTGVSLAHAARAARFSKTLDTAEAGCSPVQAIHICKTGNGISSTADMLAGLNAEDQMCMSLLCDKKGKTKCCEARDALLLSGVAPEAFKHSADAVIKMPNRPDEKPPTIIAELQPQARTKCFKEYRNIYFDADKTFKVLFSLPDDVAGSTVDLQCGPTAADPDATVTFECNDQLMWTLKDGRCEKSEAVKCREYSGDHAFQLRVKFSNDVQASAVYRFNLPEQPNVFKQDVDVQIRCPGNAKNAGGKATFTCSGDGEWSLKEEMCSAPPEGVCPTMKIALQLNEYTMDYNIPSKEPRFGGPFPAYTDGDRVDDVPCEFGPFKHGSASLICQKGQWAFDANCHEHSSGSSSTKPVPIAPSSATGGTDCGPTQFTFALNDTPHDYVLDGGALGAVSANKCQHGKLSDGDVIFECKERDSAKKWTYVSNTCSAAAGTGCRWNKLTLNMNTNGKVTPWKFTLEETDAPGEFEFQCPSGYEGTAKFQCEDNNSWKYIKGSATCKAA